MASWYSRMRTKSGANTSGALLPRARRQRVWGAVRGTGRKDSAALALAVAKRALQATRKLNADRELKFNEMTFVNYDVGTDCSTQWPGSTGAVVGNGGAVCPLHYISSGLGDTQRVGEQIVAKQIEIRGHLANGFPYGSGALRMIVFRDKQTIANSGLPLPATVLQVLRTNSLLNYNNIDRYEVFVDQTFNFQDVQIQETHCSRTPFYFKKKINVPIHFESSAATSVEKNGVYVLFLIDVFPAGTGVDTTVIVAPGDRVLMDCTARLMFQDC